MATKTELNAKLKTALSNTSQTNSIASNATVLKETKAATNATTLGNEVGKVINGYESLEKINNGSGNVENTGTAITAITEGVSGIGNQLMDAKDKVFNNTGTQSASTAFMNADGTVDSDALSQIQNADSAGELTLEGLGDGLFANVESIGGDIANSVSQIITILTGLAKLNEGIQKLQDANLGGSGLDALKATGDTMAEKGDALMGSISDTVGDLGNLATSGSLQEFGQRFNEFGQGLNEIANDVSAITNFNPVTDVIDNMAADTGVQGLVQDATKTVTDLTNETNNILNKVNEGITSVTNGIGDGILEATGVLNTTKTNSTGGQLQNQNEDFSNQFKETLTNITSGATLSITAVSSIMDDVNSGKPEGMARAVRTTMASDTTMSKEIKTLIGNSKETYNTTKDFVDDIVTKAGFDQNISAEDIKDFTDRVQLHEDQLSKSDTTVFGSMDRTQGQFYSKNVDLTDYGNNYPPNGGKDTIPEFTTIDSLEELGQEIMLIARDVRNLVLHSTESYNDQFLTSEDIHLEHVDAGEEGIQYHYVIRRDGTVERGRPANIVGNAAPKSYRNTSIDIAIVGGVNAPSGNDNPDAYLSDASYTRSQWDSLESFIEAFYRRYPGGNVCGHNQITNDKSIRDPHFDVKAYVKSRFGKG